MSLTLNPAQKGPLFPGASTFPETYIYPNPGLTLTPASKGTLTLTPAVKQ